MTRGRGRAAGFGGNAGSGGRPSAGRLLALLLLLPSLLLLHALHAGSALPPAGAEDLHFNSDRPPVATTGGFGEDDCTFCHLDFDVNEPGGTLELLGLPATGYVPGQTLALEVRLHHAELRRGGFQLTARFSEGEGEGEQAGTLAAGEGQRLQTPGYTPIAYLGHALDGLEPTGGGERRWRFEWRAPAEGGAVVFHIAGNAADGDGSEWGDRIFTRAAVLRPAR